MRYSHRVLINWKFMKILFKVATMWYVKSSTNCLWIKIRSNFCPSKSKVHILRIMMKILSSLCTTSKTVRTFQLLLSLQIRHFYMIKILINCSNENFIIIILFCMLQKMKGSSKCHFVHTLNIKEFWHFVKHQFHRTSAKSHQKDMKNNSISFKTKFTSDLCMDLSTHICILTANTLF
jgi:hypothetical protein